MISPHALTPPYLTPDLPGIHGEIRTSPQDFIVEEIPAYTPSGQGEYLFLWIEKRGQSAEYFMRHVARSVGIRMADVGMAGLKDRHAVTRQWVSVPAYVEPRLHNIASKDVDILQVQRHTNKLRTGHLRGNRFDIVIRNVTAEVSHLTRLVERIREHGLPNYYGEQRFGMDGETLTTGLAILQGTTLPKPVRSPFLKRLALSSVQSAVFNQYLARRMADGLLRRVLPGDVMGKLPQGGMFVSDDVATDQARFVRREIMSMGPIVGRKTFPSKGDAAEREAMLLAEVNLTPQSFTGFGKVLQGTRRHNLVYVDDLGVETTAGQVRLRFSLPAGSYATVLLREIMKNGMEGHQAEDVVEPNT